LFRTSKTVNKNKSLFSDQREFIFIKLIFYIGTQNLFGDYQKSAPNDAITLLFGLEENPLRCHDFPPLVPPGPRGGTGHNAIVPEQVIQHNRNGGCPSGGGEAPKSGFLMLLIHWG
jgi:hypothetical protein